MARDLNHGAVEVGVEPTPICSATQDVSSVLVQNTSDVPVFVGSKDVSTDGPRRGIMIGPGETHAIPSYPHDVTVLWAVVEPKDDNESSAVVVFMMPH